MINAIINVGCPKPIAFKKSVWCFSRKSKGHKKNYCGKFNAWLENKQKSGGNPLVCVCFESNLVEVPINSWQFDCGSTTDIDESLQGFKNIRKPSL